MCVQLMQPVVLHSVRYTNHDTPCLAALDTGLTVPYVIHSSQTVER